MKRLPLLLTSLLINALLCGSSLYAAPLEEAEQQLQSRQFKEAAASLAKEKGDYSSYLRATAQFLAGDFPAAEKTTRALLKAQPDSEWRTKARYLLARALIEQRKHEAAEKIYAAEADRVFSEDRKEEIAGRLIEFADKLSEEPDPTVLDALPPDHQKALGLYEQVLAMEIGRDLRDDVLFKKGNALAKLDNHAEAITAFQLYLAEFDPKWAGSWGSSERRRGQLKENPVASGRHRLEARRELIREQLQAGPLEGARQNTEDLLALTAEEPHDDPDFIPSVHLLQIRAADNNGADRTRGIATRRAFLKAHPAHREAPTVARGIAELFSQNGQPDEAITAYEEFIAGKDYTFVAEGKNTTPDPETGVSPAEALQRSKEQALYQIGLIRNGQKDYPKAIDAFRAYVAQHPNGAEWSASQAGILNAEFQMAIDAVAAGETAAARTQFEAFLKKYPLDTRAPQILFTLGQMDVTEGEDAEEEDHTEDAAPAYRKAIASWARLISKYPGTEESSLALYRTGVLYAEKLDQLEDGLAAFRRLNWGSWATPAQGRVTLLSERSLGVATERIFRTGEEAQISVTSRNIEKLTVSLYPLNPEAYFRKTHRLGRVDHLDIDLIQPLSTWEVDFEDFKKYREITRDIPIPFPEDGPSAGIVKVEGGDWSATTLVLRSDIELILKSSKREVLVYAQDLKRGVPAAGAELLISDGSKILGTGVTGDDGVYRGRFEDLKASDSVRVFAQTDQGFATNLLDIGALQFSTGLTARGYLYSDKPAYRPGEAVNVRGIIRDVEDGSYVVPEKRDWEFSVTDPAGRLLAGSEIKLDRFGAFDSVLDLPASAQLGTYTIAAFLPDGGTRWTGTFEVAEFRMDRIRLALDFDRTVYFRGEKVEGTVRATYYWGSPASGEQISTQLPDGRTITGKTDEKGELAISLDTAGFTPGTPLSFTASVPAHNINSNQTVFLANLGFGIKVNPAQPLALSGEPFEIELTTKGADGKPVGRDLTLTVLRSEPSKTNPTLEAVPWLNHAPPAAETVTVEEHQITTDPKTGEGRLTLKLDKGGIYTLRASGEDRFEQVVTGMGRVGISDNEDENKLRFFAEKNTYEVGAEIPLRLHSRVASKLALLTYEGEEILGHEIIALKKGYNAIPTTVAHAHFPNFRVSVALIDDTTLRAASKRFAVKRELKIAINPEADPFVPGEEGKVDLLVTDQLGNPVEAAISLALVNEALFARHPDNTPKIVPFFQEGAERYTEFLLVSTAGFTYTALSQKRVKKETDSDFEYEVILTPNRIEQRQNILNQELNLNPTNNALFASCQSNHFSVFNNGRANGQFSATEFDPPEIPQVFAQNAQIVDFNGFIDYGQPIQTNGQRQGQVLNDIPLVGRLFQQNNGFPVTPTTPTGFNQPGQIEVLREMDYAYFDASDMAAREDIQFAGTAGFVAMNGGNQSGVGGGGFGSGSGGVAPNTPPSATDHATLWRAPIVTDKKGRASLTLPLPDTAGQWRLTARGTTVETLVGEATEKVVTARDFFADLRLPETLQEGDVMPLLATIHNLGDFKGAAALKLTIEGGAKPFKSTESVAINPETATEIIFKEFTVPSAPALSITLTSSAGDAEHTITRQIPVRPWGLEYASAAAGLVSDQDGATLELPKGQKYTSQSLRVTLSPSIQQALIDLALARGSSLQSLGASPISCYLPANPQSPPSALLAAASALQYARDRKAPAPEIAALHRRTAELVSALVSSQKEDGFWPINAAPDTENFISSATAYWALALADRAGVSVHPAALSTSEAALRASITKTPADDNETKAILAHALSLSKDGDFPLANRLYRDRHKLSENALAYLAATFVRMNREGFAKDCLDLLAAKHKTINLGGKSAFYWPGGTRSTLIRDRAETTALALWAYAHIDRDSNIATCASDFLLAESASPRSTRSLGAVVHALAAYYDRDGQPDEDFSVELLLNDEVYHTTTSDELRSTAHFVIAGAPLTDGENTFRIRLKGRGEIRYAATLSGFSPDMKDPKSFEYPHLTQRHFYHDRLTYRDVPLKARSTSPVSTLNLGQRYRVHVDLETRYQRPDYLVLEERIPAGTLYIEGSATGGHTRLERRGDRLRFHFRSGKATDVGYELVAHAPGSYRVLPPVLFDATDRGRMRLGTEGKIEILGTDEASDTPYVMNHSEHFELANKLFADGKFPEAQAHLDTLWANEDNRRRYEKDLARMLLWIHTEREELEAPRIVEVFEVLRERHPELVIPFDKTLVVGRAYREIGEFERAWLVFRAAINSSFLNDSRIAAVLEDQGQYLGAVAYQEDLWFRYPDSAEVTSSLFALSQSLFKEAPNARALATRQGREGSPNPPEGAPSDRPNESAEEDTPERTAMLEDSARLLHRFLTLYPTDPLADDAAFSETNVRFALKDYPGVVLSAERGAARHPESSYRSSFDYMAALGHFWQRHYQEALAGAVAVAEGDSKDRDYARYITAQIHHATGKPAEAMNWYRKVRELYPDAAQAIAYFEKQKITVPEVTTVLPGEPVELPVGFRNIREASLQIYEVDLLKLYLREKNLSDIAKIDLAGIDPAASITVPLGDGKDFADKEKAVTLELANEGAYLVICRGDDLFTSGLVLITPLKLEIQEDPAGAVRVNVRDTTAPADAGGYVPEVLVKVVGTANPNFLSGHTDLRGLYEADGVLGTATVLAKSGERQYAFYRGTTSLGPLEGDQPEPEPAPESEPQKEAANASEGKPQAKGKRQLKQNDYLDNVLKSNIDVQDQNWKAWDDLRRSDNKGVEVKKAY